MKVVFEKDKFILDENLIEKISLECGILKDTARLLLHRNIDTVEKAKIFLNPSKKYFYNPFLLKNMDLAVNRIKEAKEKNQTILIFGDYDADGVCASTVLYSALMDFGVNCYAVIPERDDGYGLSVEMISKILEKTKIDLVITVDCGITEAQKIDEIKKLGLDFIVTDHHEPPEILPNCLCINPKIAGQKYPFNGLCGAGVAYKLAYALIDEKADKYLDFVALATVADSMDLIDENRNIVYEGLKIFNSDKLRTCFKYCLTDNTKQITAQTLAFTLAPRINAGGRMGDANSALNLFLEEDENEKFNLAVRLNMYNTQRQAECDEIYRQAKLIIKEKKLYNDSIILIYNENWKTGFVGIVAAKILEEYSRPVIVFAGQNGFLKGSARSVEGINIYEIISSVKDLLVTFGGHSQAAGVTLDKKNFSAFKKGILTYLSQQSYKISTEKIVSAEWNIEGEFSKQFAKEIELLEPCGVGNKRPMFTTEVDEIKALPIKLNSPHISFNSNCLEMIEFNGISDLDRLNAPVKKQILFETNISLFKNKEYLKGYVKEVICNFNNFSKMSPYIFSRQLKRIRENGENKKLDIVENIKINGVGTCFIASSFDNISNEFNELPKYLFKRNDRRFNNCIIIDCDEIPSNFERAIYLDIPYSVLPFENESYVIKDAKQSLAPQKVSTCRNDFIDTYMALKGMINKEFISSYHAFYRQKIVDNIYQFIFATEVFLDLQIIYVENGLLKLNDKNSKELSSSKVYNRIVEING